MTMFWFNGSINEAINKSKNEKKVFVVFVNGSDEISRKMNNLFESLSTKLSELPLVAIRLESESDNCKLFSQIYPVILIPSTYFIDFNGVAIEIIGGSVEDQNVLFDKISKTIEVYEQSLPSNASENRIQTTNVSNNLLNNELSAGTSATQSIPPTDSIPQNLNVSQTPNIEEKVERANHLIEAIREKKAKEAAEKEREDETNRRKEMKEMQKSKRLREEKEVLEAAQEREREKNEERLARERVLAQIAADREERKKRQLQFNDKQSSGETSVGTSSDGTDVRQRVVNDKTRIQFRLPDGSTANNIFEAKDTLETVGQYVSSQFNINSFVLSTTFPRKEFVTEDYCKTLEELSLCPSSVLLVLFKNRVNSTGALASPSLFWQIVTYVSLPFLMIWNIITSIFSRPNRMDSSEDPNRQLPKKKNPKTFSNREGNVARIRDPMGDEDDDNNTWNGNSTQQM